MAFFRGRGRGPLWPRPTPPPECMQLTLEQQTRFNLNLLNHPNPHADMFPHIDPTPRLNTRRYHAWNPCPVAGEDEAASILSSDGSESGIGSLSGEWSPTPSEAAGDRAYPVSDEIVTVTLQQNNQSTAFQVVIYNEKQAPNLCDQRYIDEDVADNETCSNTSLQAHGDDDPEYCVLEGNFTWADDLDPPATTFHEEFQRNYPGSQFAYIVKAPAPEAVPMNGNTDWNRYRECPGSKRLAEDSTSDDRPDKHTSKKVALISKVNAVQPTPNFQPLVNQHFEALRTKRELLHGTVVRGNANQQLARWENAAEQVIAREHVRKRMKDHQVARQMELAIERQLAEGREQETLNRISGKTRASRIESPEGPEESRVRNYDRNHIAAFYLNKRLPTFEDWRKRIQPPVPGDNAAPRDLECISYHAEPAAPLCVKKDGTVTTGDPRSALQGYDGHLPLTRAQEKLYEILPGPMETVGHPTPIELPDGSEEPTAAEKQHQIDRWYSSHRPIDLDRWFATVRISEDSTREVPPEMHSIAQHALKRYSLEQGARVQTYSFGPNHYKNSSARELEEQRLKDREKPTPAPAPSVRLGRNKQRLKF